MKQELTKEQRIKAKRMNKDFFDTCKYALECGCYFEAYLKEYNAMESRMHVIMSILKQPCEMCEIEELRHDVGLGTKFKCLNSCKRNNKEIFEKTKLNSAFFGKILFWNQCRNKIVHALYENPDSFEQLSKDTKEQAIKGYEYVRLVYNETERLKRLHRRKPELFENIVNECYINPNTNDYQNNCKPLIEYMKNKDTQ